MADLGDTVADLLSLARGGVNAGGPSPLTRCASFGPNPGGLVMWLHAPSGLARGAPLVVVLHGCGQTAAGYAGSAGWVELAERHGFVLLCPEQSRANNPNGCFNWFEDEDIRRGGGEAASIAQMVRHAVRDMDLDAQRVFITGLSAGGAMTAVMLATYADLFAAGAVIAGLPYGAASGVGEAMGAMRGLSPRSATAWGDRVRAAGAVDRPWPKISVWHGDADLTVAPAAGAALVQQWCDVHGVTRPETASTGSGRHMRQLWRRDDGEVVVELNRIVGLGHGTPIATAGPHGCGAAAPWVLEAGVSSSREIARTWGLTASLRETTSPPPQRKAPQARTAALKPRVRQDVGETIARALRSAGLM